MNGDAGRSRTVHDLEALLRGPWQVLLIDGRSGAGKTSLAQRIAAEYDAQILSLEDLYPGWSGLAAGSLAVVDALAAGEYRPYNWHTRAFAATGKRLDPARSLIIEGCGAITSANLTAARRWANVRAQRLGDDRISSNEPSEMSMELSRSPRVRSMWLDAEPNERRRRALQRDGEVFAPHWEAWAAQEHAFYAQHRPWQLASIVLTRQ